MQSKKGDWGVKEERIFSIRGRRRRDTTTGAPLPDGSRAGVRSVERRSPASPYMDEEKIYKKGL